ncbi:MAG: presenilin family intramembrane aspartyl protease [Nanoarchaeota archaeon]
MKHNIKITVIVLLIFLLAQFIGIVIIYKYIDPLKSAETGKTEFKQLPIGERPPLEEKTSFIPIIIAILIGTVILLLLMKYNLTLVWKLWFLIAVVLSLTVAWGVFVRKEIAAIIALAAGIWKIFRPNVWIHNFTELFVYGGLAAIFVPLFNIWSIVILLVLISGYDAYAVWKSKHMITLAKSQTEAKIFAGFFIPYKLGKAAGKKITGKRSADKKIGTAAPKKVLTTVKTAVLGGGDIGFPLIFAGVLLKEYGLWQSLIIPFGALLGLSILLWKGKEDKFYPAMPFISAGCFLGLLVVWGIEFFL